MNIKKRELDSCLDKIDEAICKDREFLPDSVKPPGMETLSLWFRSLTSLQHVEGGVDEFCNDAARTITEAGGLDGAVLVLNTDRQPIDDLANCTLETYGLSKSGTVSPIRIDLLDLVLAENATIYHSSRKLNDSEIQVEIATVAISPVRNKSNEIIGFLLGWREQTHANNRKGIRDLEAHFVRLVANTISASLVRYHNETRIEDQNALLAQAFPPKVIEYLKTDPDLFEGRELVVSVLFADLRGFSAISNRLPARQTYLMINEIMDLWTRFVTDLSGAVVDYFGDGLVAFWNAPLQVDNHAAQAIQCAQKIQLSLPGLTEKWAPVIGCPVDVGVGISTGLAHVGNCGCKQRVKYGPHGSVVNLAARLEKLTKEFEVPIVISDETARDSQEDFLSRRIGKANIRGFDSAVDVYQPILDPQNFDLIYIQEYEAVLEAIESGETGEDVARRLQSLQESNPHDRTIKRLIGQLNGLPKPGRVENEDRDKSGIW